jgi:hypothetical protein
MSLILLVLLIVVVLAGAGFALHVLWILAAALLVVWLLGFVVSGAGTQLVSSTEKMTRSPSS